MSKRKTYSISDLILFSLYSLPAKNNISFERLVKECFQSFPQVFSFKQYSQWPDARKLDRPLRLLRGKKFISIDRKTGNIGITSLGQKRAKEVSKLLRQGKLL
ncbi:hypothetical protein J7J23_03120 [bacterium]|nr:hypothetical protein [bacterium]